MRYFIMSLALLSCLTLAGTPAAAQRQNVGGVREFNQQISSNNRRSRRRIQWEWNSRRRQRISNRIAAQRVWRSRMLQLRFLSGFPVHSNSYLPYGVNSFRPGGINSYAPYGVNSYAPYGVNSYNPWR